MTRDVYLYPGRSTDAALHLQAHSALAGCTDVEPTFYAGADCLRVTLTTPMPSRGERLLWATLEGLSYEDGTVPVCEAAATLDGESLEALHAAIGALFFGVEAVSS